MLKSGSEFREFSVLTVKFPEGKEPGSRPNITVQRCEVTKQDIPNPEMQNIVEKYLNEVREGEEREGEGERFIAFFNCH